MVLVVTWMKILEIGSEGTDPNIKKTSNKEFIVYI
jgi:hypothetical protein